MSHAYADEDRRSDLLRSLPSQVESVVFPPMAASPEEAVSDRLVDALLGCDGLIYLTGGASDRSFWVAFERDYALRAGKRVFRADGATLTTDTSSPLDLAAFASYHRADQEAVRSVVDYLEEERHFDVWFDADDILVGASLQDEVDAGIRGRLERGGYVVVFWSEAARNSEYVDDELETAMRGLSQMNDRVLFALLEDVPLPAFWLRYQEPGVQLFGDRERSRTQRIDDLVVRLYWLIYRKTHTPNPQ